MEISTNCRKNVKTGAAQIPTYVYFASMCSEFNKVLSQSSAICGFNKLDFKGDLEKFPGGINKSQ
jgi:hypothetical protein